MEPPKDIGFAKGIKEWEVDHGKLKRPVVKPKPEPKPEPPERQPFVPPALRNRNTVAHSRPYETREPFCGGC